MHRFAAATAGVIALVTFAAACGDDSSTADTVASTPAAAETTVVEETVVEETVVEETVVEETVVEETMVDDTMANDAPGADTEFCALNEELDTVGDAAMNSEATPENVQQFFEVDFPAAIEKITAAAPPEIADDLAISVEGFNLLAERLAANGWDLTATFSDPATAELLDVQKYSDASDAISEFCGS